VMHPNGHHVVQIVSSLPMPAIVPHSAARETGAAYSGEDSQGNQA
jgi:hypothetical protein